MNLENIVNGGEADKIGRSEQLNLFSDVNVDPGPIVKSALAASIKQSPLSREEITDKMNEIAERSGISCNGSAQRVTLSVLDKWTAHSANKHHIPLRMLPIFCQSAGSNLVLEAYSRFFKGIRIIDEEDFQALRWARAELDLRKKKKLAKRLLEEIG